MLEEFIKRLTDEALVFLAKLDDKELTFTAFLDAWYKEHPATSPFISGYNDRKP